MRLLKNINQTGAAAMAGVVIMALLVLTAVTLGFLALSAQSGNTPSLTVNPPKITPDDLLTEGTSNNELLIDTQIVEAGIKRDEEQRKAAEAALNDETLPVGDGVTAATTVESQRLSGLQTEYIAEADRRLQLLSEAAGAANKLQADQKAIATKLINDETTILTGLKAKAAAETTKEAFLADRTELEKEYVNFGLAIAQTSMLVWIKDQAVLNEKANVLGGKFQERLNTASSSGASTASAQTVLNGYQTNKTLAKEYTEKGLAAILAVKPNTYEANRAVLQTYYTQLAGAHNELSKSLVAAKDMVTQIRAFKTD